MKIEQKPKSTKGVKLVMFSAAAAALVGGTSALIQANTGHSFMTNATSVLGNAVGVKEAHALGTKDIEWNKEGIQQNNTFLINVPNGSVGGKTSWGISGQTKIMNAKGSAPAESTGKNTDSYGYTWGVVNKPKTPQPVYSLATGSQYRLTNVGKTTTGQAFDVLITMKGTSGDTGRGKGISFVDSAQLGSGTDPFHSIALLVSGVYETNIHVDYLKPGTNDKVNITTGTYWSDIDIHQGVNENQSNNHVIFGGVDDNNTNKMAVDGNTVYSTTEQDIDGMNNPNQGAYIGIGSGTGFDVHYYNPYRGGGNSWITDTDVKDFLYFRYDLFGRYDNLEFPVPVTNPKKTVTDIDEKQSNKNTVGIKERKQHYDVSIDVGQGVASKLTMTDTLPQGFKTDTGRIKVHNKAGKDLTSLFDVKLEGQKVTVNLKNSALTNQDLRNTTVTVGIDGDLTSEWGPADLKNNAVWNDGKDHPTGDVHSYMPSKPEAKKSVSTDGGKNFVPANTPQSASALKTKDSGYTWKNEFKLSNHTVFNKVVFTDHVENLQNVDTSKVKVYDWNGADITKNGSVTTKANGDKTDVIWTASKDYVNELNKAFGRDSDKVPTFSYTIATDLSKATDAQLNKYLNKDTKSIVIPNQTTLTEGDASGDVSVDTNKSHVKVPGRLKNPKKTVTDLDEKQGNKNTVGIKERKQHYDVSTDVTVGSHISQIVMKDKLPAGFKTDTGRIKVHNKAGKDITSLFDIKLDGQNLTATLKDSAKTSADIFNTTLTVGIDGKLTKDWGPMDLVNDAVWTDDKDHSTGKVHSYMPSKPTAHKQVSVDGGKKFVDAASPEAAAALKDRPQDYTWKNTFTLSNHSVFNKVQFVDHLENLQAVDNSKIHVLDWNGNDITKNGAITTKASGDKTDIIWTANADYVASINKSFGRDSDKKPTFTYNITTNIKNATDKQESKYWDEKGKTTIIPNQTTLIEGDISGEVNTDTNKSHVKTPTPSAPTVKKQVAKNGTNPTKETGWNDSLQLSNHDQKYSYRTTFNLSKNYNFDGGNLVLTDHFENLQSFKSVKIVDAQGKDISTKFDIKQTKKDAKTDIVATVKGASANDFDDKGATIYMVIDGATLEGATGVQELNYQEPHTKEAGATADEKDYVTDPFKEGITVPNISALDELSSKPGNSYHKDTNHTYVNFAVNPSIAKYVEDDNDSESIIDPNLATDAKETKDDKKSSNDNDDNSNKSTSDNLDTSSRNELASHD